MAHEVELDAHSVFASYRSKLLATNYFVENEWLDKYIQLVIANTNTEHVPNMTQSHHIIPVSYFQNRNIEVDDSSDNRVNLIYKDHMKAHLYMSGCTQGRDRYKNLYSVFMMSGYDKEGFKDIQNYDRYQELYVQAINAAPNHRKGTKVSEETRMKMEVATRQRLIDYGPTVNKGTIWVHKDGVNKNITKDKLEEYLADGYIHGRHVNVSEEGKARQDYARRNKVITPEFREKMREIGRLSNIGRDPETYKKQGRWLSEYYKTHTNPFKGKKHTEYSKELNRLKHLGRKAINKDGVQKNVWPDELEKYINEGWALGRPKKGV